ncbi:MAG: hypothetical protein E7080_10495 [Bacteroidales bacterium]|jgi:hypothetical protein|nr:hypothetical protein [Bacteroidales bacterium]
MKIKILQKNGCAILAVLCLIGLCLPFVDAYNGAERSIYSNVKNAKDYEVDYECMKYLDKYPKGEYAKDVSNILISKMKKDGDIKRTYKLGVRYASLEVGKKLKELSYKMAEIKNDYYSWSQYLEVCNIEDIKDAQERLNKCTN